MNNLWLSAFFIKIEILVPSIDEINQLKRQNVMIYHMKRHSDGYLVTIRKGSEKYLPGPYTMVRNYSIYPGMVRFIGPILAISFFLLILMDNYTVGFVIEGNLNDKEEAELEAILMPHFTKIGPFEFLKSDLQDIQQELEEIYNEYVWININRRGTDIVFEVYDTPSPEIIDEDHNKDTIYARRSGVVSKVNAKSCRVLVEPGQLVKLGEPLISCNVLDPSGSGDILYFDDVAQGEIWAETWYDVNITFLKEYVEEILTTRIQRQFTINIGSWQFKFPSEDPKFENYEVSIKTYDPFFFMEQSPLFLEKIQYYEKSDIMKLNDLEEIKDNVYVLIKNEFNDQTNHEFEVKNLEIISMDEKDNEIALRYHVTILENIAH